MTLVSLVVGSELGVQSLPRGKVSEPARNPCPGDEETRP